MAWWRARSRSRAGPRRPWALCLAGRTSTRRRGPRRRTSTRCSRCCGSCGGTGRTRRQAAASSPGRGSASSSTARRAAPTRPRWRRRSASWFRASQRRTVPGSRRSWSGAPRRRRDRGRRCSPRPEPRRQHSRRRPGFSARRQPRGSRPRLASCSRTPLRGRRLRPQPGARRPARASGAFSPGAPLRAPRRPRRGNPGGR
mmetsp:Transcript_138626/g.431196  ORF Transcript_138626/g.431196 Transcript_138626/m.431196 type:complete len:200 (-) Transcript_138626:600-1199(-)